MPKFISGPVNYIKLIGSINGIQKIIYILMDVHNDIDSQTKCESFDTEEISHYIYKKIKNAQKPLDFFMEIRSEQFTEPRDNKKDIYFKEVIDLFKSEFVMEKDQVKYSKTNPNVKLHYLDIRDHLDLFDVVKYLKIIIDDYLPPLKKNIEHTNNISRVFKIDKYVKKIEAMIKQIKNIYNEIKKNKLKYKISKDANYYFNKIIHEYTHDEVKDKLNQFLDSHLEIEITRVLSILYSLKRNIIPRYLDDIGSIKCFNKLNENIDILDKLIVDIYSLITDVYFLRRILDKDYISNVITYCGRQHAINYLFVLIKYFDFKLVKIYTTYDTTSDNIISEINKVNNVRDIYKLFMPKQEMIQCIDFLDMKDILYM